MANSSGLTIRDRRRKRLRCRLTLLALPAALAACSNDDREARRNAAGPQPSLERLMAVASPAAGGRLFRQCMACHTIGRGAPNGAGPNLYAVFGRPIAADPTYGYTHALKSLGGIWDPMRLDAWLAAPSKVAPGTKMAYAGLDDPLDRADMIAYLKSQSEARGE